MPISPEQAQEFEKLGIPLPTSDQHNVTPDDIREKLKPLPTTNWRLQGNVLTCDTPEGPFSQTLPTDVILTGTDDQGYPILTRIDI